MKYLDEVVIYKKFLTVDEIADLKTFAIDTYNSGRAKPETWFNKQYGHKLSEDRPYRYLYNFESVDNFDKCTSLCTVYKRIKDTIEINSFKQYHVDPLIGFVVAYTLPGAFIQKHSDRYDNPNNNLLPYYKDKRHIRFNLMINRDVDKSYNPCTADNKEFGNNYKVDVGDAWCFPPDKLLHYMSRLVGNEMRIVYQFGFAIDVGEQ